MKNDDGGDNIRIRNWSNVRAHYTYAGTPEKPCLILTLELDVTAYEPTFLEVTDQNKTTQTADVPLWQQNAINDKENLSAICFQLEQNYDDLGISDLSGHAVSIFIIDSLLKSEKIALSPEAVQVVRNFAADCLIYVGKRSNGWDGGVQPVRRLEIPFSLADISESDVTALSLTLSFEARELPTISPPETPITKFECDIRDLTVLLNDSDDFGETFEGIFHNEDWKMRIGKNAPVPHSPEEKQSDETLAIRIGKKTDAGFYYVIQNQPVHFAPRPIAQTLESATVSIYQYDAAANSFSADKVTLSFSDIDLNVFAKTAFSAIDNFFSPRMINAVSQIDSLFPGDSEPQESRLAKFWRHKKTIAESTAETVMPIFKSDEIDEISLVAAREMFRQSSMIRLSNAFVSNCATVFNVSNVSIDRQKTEELLPGRFYGHFQRYETTSPEAEEAGNPTENPARDFLLSSGNIEYFQAEDGQTGDWRLPLLFSSEYAGQQPDFALPVSYALTHLETGRIKKTGDGKSEEQSKWIQLAGEPIITQIGYVEFPLIGNEMPSAPFISTQKTDSSDASVSLTQSASSLSESTIFDYPLNYEHQLSVRDLVRVSVSINDNKPSTNSESEAHPLFAALVQFAPACNYIYENFEQYVGKINASSRSTDTDVINAKKALDAFDLIFEELAAAYEQRANSAKGMTLSDERSSESDSFDIVLKAGADGHARVDIISKDSDLKSPIPFLIEIQDCIQREAPDKPDYAAASYNYIFPVSSQTEENDKDASVKYLSYDDALKMPHRTILLKGLNIFTDQNISAQIQAFANETVGIDKTATIDDCFKMFSSPARCESSDIFSLHFSDFDLSAIKVSESTLENYLDGFFASLLKEAAETPVWLKMTVSFSSQLQDSETEYARTVLPIILMPPVQVIPKNGEPLPIIPALAGQISDWTKSINPALDASSEYNIYLEVYGEESDHKFPLIVIDNVFIKISKMLENN